MRKEACGEPVGKLYYYSRPRTQQLSERAPRRECDEVGVVQGRGNALNMQHIRA